MLVVSVLGVQAKAQSMHSTSALGQGAALSSSYTNSLWFSRNVSGVDQYGSAFFYRYDPITDRSWGITAGHNFDVGTNYRVGTGTNWMTDRGTEFNITSFAVHPQAVPGGFVGTEVDLAVFSVSGRIMAPDLTIAPAVLGEVVTYGKSLGRGATPGGGFLPANGQGYTFQTYVDLLGSGSTSTDYAIGVFRSSGPAFLPLGGVGTPGGSGAGVFNQLGQPVAVAVASTGIGYLDGTTSLRLSLYEPWINSIAVPTPSGLALLGVGALFAARRRRG
jgi:MYXO-CTERM domain-containing protein